MCILGMQDCKVAAKFGRTLGQKTECDIKYQRRGGGEEKAVKLQLHQTFHSFAVVPLIHVPPKHFSCQNQSYP